MKIPTIKTLTLPAFIAMLFISIGLASCREESGKASNAEATEQAEALQENEETMADSTIREEFTPEQIDSIRFIYQHHFGINFNFEVTDDSLTLLPDKDNPIQDTCHVYKDNIIAVASIRVEPSDSIDSIWVKVARDQFTMGWIRESELLDGVVPNDTISKAIKKVSGYRGIGISVILCLGMAGFLLRRARHGSLRIARFEDMDSIFPPLFMVLTATLGTVYASIRNFAPDLWQEYYFHPTLNPLTTTAPLAVLIVNAWLVLMALLAMLDEIYHNLTFGNAVCYILETIGLAMVVYIFFYLTSFIYIGYILLPIFILANYVVYKRFMQRRYVCGNCGKLMRRKGVCPNCGTLNE